MPALLFAQDRCDLNLHQQFRADQSLHFDHGCGRLDRAEELAVRPADLFPFGNIGDEHARADDILERCASRGQCLFDLSKAEPCLLVGIVQADDVPLLIHGGRNTWEGNEGYNDGHVNFETRADPIEITYRRASGSPLTVPDNFFVDENDDAATGTGTIFQKNINQYMRPIGNVTGTDTAGYNITFYVD